MAQPWADLYGDSRAVSIAVTFTHLGGLLIAGGTAIAADRATLSTPVHDTERRRQLDVLAAAHRAVLVALIAVVVSGILLFAADIETYRASPVYWTKMTLVALLLGNGYRMAREERTIRRDGLDAARWRRLRNAAVASIALWLLTTLAGVVLVEAA
jgi:hypothetical protein